MGRDAQQPHRRGRGHREAAGRPRPRRARCARAAPDGGRAHLSGRHDGAGDRPGHRTHAFRSQQTRSPRSTEPTSACTDPTWISRFTDATRQAAAYRSGRVLLAGDAAHIHYPAGGQGIGLGIQDAVNLGWKLAQVVNGVSPQSLLDTYHAERHPAGARALRHSMAQTALQRADPRTTALSETIDDLMTTAPARTQIAALIHGLDVAYDLGQGHPLLGRRMPDLDLDLETAGGPIRVYSLLHDARPLFLDFAGSGRIDISPWADRVRAHRRAVHRRVGAAGTGRGRSAHGCARAARRSRGMGRSRKR